MIINVKNIQWLLVYVFPWWHILKIIWDAVTISWHEFCFLALDFYWQFRFRFSTDSCQFFRLATLSEIGGIFKSSFSLGNRVLEYFNELKNAITIKWLKPELLFRIDTQRVKVFWPFFASCRITQTLWLLLYHYSRPAPTAAQITQKQKTPF